MSTFFENIKNILKNKFNILLEQEDEDDESSEIIDPIIRGMHVIDSSDFEDSVENAEELSQEISSLFYDVYGDKKREIDIWARRLKKTVEALTPEEKLDILGHLKSSGDLGKTDVKIFDRAMKYFEKLKEKEDEIGEGLKKIQDEYNDEIQSFKNYKTDEKTLRILDDIFGFDELEGGITEDKFKRLEELDIDDILEYEFTTEDLTEEDKDNIRQLAVTIKDRLLELQRNYMELNGLLDKLEETLTLPEKEDVFREKEFTLAYRLDELKDKFNDEIELIKKMDDVIWDILDDIFIFSNLSGDLTEDKYNKLNNLDLDRLLKREFIKRSLTDEKIKERAKEVAYKLKDKLLKIIEDYIDFKKELYGLRFKKSSREREPTSISIEDNFARSIYYIKKLTKKDLFSNIFRILYDKISDYIANNIEEIENEEYSGIYSYIYKIVNEKFSENDIYRNLEDKYNLKFQSIFRDELIKYISLIKRKVYEIKEEQKAEKLEKILLPDYPNFSDYLLKYILY